MQKPIPFDTTKKYPVLFYVYTEPGRPNGKGSIWRDALPYLSRETWPRTGISIFLWTTGVHRHPKERPGEKPFTGKSDRSISTTRPRQLPKSCKWPFVDTSRIAVWGWSGGGSATLNLMFQHPEIYKTGLAVAALGNLETYDNIYQERYMGNPLETKADYVKGSPITYASGLQGNLLYIHGERR